MSFILTMIIVVGAGNTSAPPVVISQEYANQVACNKAKDEIRQATQGNVKLAICTAK